MTLRNRSRSNIAIAAVVLALGALASEVRPAPEKLQAPLAEVVLSLDLAGVRAWYVAGGLAGAAMGAPAFLVRPVLEMEARTPKTPR